MSFVPNPHGGMHVQEESELRESRDHYLVNITNTCLLIDALTNAWVVKGDEAYFHDLKKVRRVLMKGLIE